MRGNVVFDFGAVLFRWEPLRLFQQTLPELAPDAAHAAALAAQVFQSFVPGSDWSRFDLGLIEPDELAARIARRTGLSETAVQRLIAAVPDHLEPLHDTVAIVRRLQAEGHRVVFLSNMPRPYADVLERRNPFVSELEGGIFSGREGLMKPWPAIYQLAQHRLGLQGGERTVFIDDHAGNIEAARRHGWEGIVFVGAAALEGSLREGGWLTA